MTVNAAHPAGASPRAVVRRSLSYSIYEGMTAMPLVYLNQPGNYLLVTLLAGTLAFDTATYGAIVSLPFWCNFLQLFITPLLARHLSNRRVFLLTAWSNIVAWAGIIAVLWWLAGHDTAAAPLLFGSAYFIGGLAMSTSGVAWTSWVQSWVPTGARGVYFAKRNRLVQISLLMYLVLTAGILEWQGRSVPIFCALFTGALLLRAASMGFAHRTPAPGEPADRRGDLRAQITSLRHNKPFLGFVAVGAAWGFTANFANPFYPVFLLQHLGFGSGQVGGFFVSALLFGALAFPAWGTLVNRHGSRPVMLCAVTLWAAVNGLWSLVTPDTRWLAYALGALGGAANAGLVLGLFYLVLKLVPPHAKALAIGFNTAVASLATALAPLAGGSLLAWCLAQGWEPELVYRGFFLMQPLLAVVTITLLLRLVEPDTAPLRRVVGAMSNLRTLGAVMGLGFLFNYLFDPNIYSRLNRTLRGKSPQR